MNAVLKRTLTWALALILMMGIVVFATACRNDAPEADRGTADAGTGTETVTPPPPPALPEVIVPVEVLDAVDALAELRELEAQFPRAFDNPRTIIPGGDFVRAWGNTNPMVGIFNPVLFTNTQCRDVSELVIPSLFARNDQMMILLGPDGHNAPTIVELNLDELYATVTMRDGVYIYWHDGVPLTLDDLVFAYEIIAHPDYTGVRFQPAEGVYFMVGAHEMKAGEADYISGLELSDDGRQLTIRFTDMPPVISFSLWSLPVPRHHFEGIAVADMEEHLNSRENILGFGPFYIATKVVGESLVMHANENYWRGRPNIDRIIWAGTDPEFISEGMRIGHFDLAGFRLTDWPYFQDMNNVAWLGQIGPGQGPLMHFTLGELYSCEDTGVVRIRDRDDGHPITDPVVRRAIAYAIDRLSIDVNWNQGFGRPATSVLSPFNGAPWIDPHNPGLSIFDLDLANQMLDEAGYEWGPDGFRLDLNGNPFHVAFGFWHTPTNEIIFQMHQQNLAQIGIDFRLYNDSWTDWNSLIEYFSSINGIHADAQYRNTGMHMHQMGWSHGGSPSQSWLWGENAVFNHSRFTTPTFQATLDRVDSMAAWCPEYLGDAIREFAAYWDRMVPAVTASWSVGLTNVNNRVVNYTTDRGRYTEDGMCWVRLGLSAPVPYAHR